MSTEPFIGEIKSLAFPFAPRGYILCQGQILSISANSTLFALVGTTYGGNGQTTFGVPDLRGRTPVGQGSGPGLSQIAMGELAGTENVTLLLTNLPPHNHPATATSTLFAESATADDNTPGGNLLATANANVYTASVPNPNQPLSSESIGTTVAVGITGSGVPVPIRNPFLGINFSMATQGLFPSRN